MIKRHDAIGIKQVIRYEWMQKAANLVLAGLDVKAIRQELHGFLADRKGNGTQGERSVQTRTFAVNNLMKIWVSPDPVLMPFRNAMLTFLRESPSMALAAHWGMISAAYPFWFNVARIVGRLLALQDHVTHAQVVGRLKEQYGDRQTVSRYAQFVIRSFVAWGVLKDSDTKGCYAKVAPVSIPETDLAILMFESALLAIPEGRNSLGLLKNHPALFPFRLAVLSGDSVSLCNKRIDVVHYDMDEGLLVLRSNVVC